MKIVSHEEDSDPKDKIHHCLSFLFPRFERGILQCPSSLPIELNLSLCQQSDHYVKKRATVNIFNVRRINEQTKERERERKFREQRKHKHILRRLPAIQIINISFSNMSVVA